MKEGEKERRRKGERERRRKGETEREREREINKIVVSLCNNAITA